MGHASDGSDGLNSNRRVKKAQTSRPISIPRMGKPFSARPRKCSEQKSWNCRLGREWHVDVQDSQGLNVSMEDRVRRKLNAPRCRERNAPGVVDLDTEEEHSARGRQNGWALLKSPHYNPTLGGQNFHKTLGKVLGFVAGP